MAKRLVPMAPILYARLMTNTGAGTDTMTVSSIIGLNRGLLFTDWTMQAQDENGGEWIVIFSSGGCYSSHSAFADLIREELARQNGTEDYSGVTICCEYNEATDKYFVTYGGYALPLKDFDFHPGG